MIHKQILPTRDTENQPIASVASRYLPLILDAEPGSKIKPPTELQNIDRILVGAIKRINEALYKFPETRHLEVQYCNILERDDNPRGDRVFFLIVNHFDFSGIRAQREEDYINYVPKRVIIPPRPEDYHDFDPYAK